MSSTPSTPPPSGTPQKYLTFPPGLLDPGRGQHIWRRLRVTRQTVIGALVTTLVLAVGAVVAFRHDNPEQVVEKFFAAIQDRDVTRALSHVGTTAQAVPYGERAAFLHPEAIDDAWELLEVEESSQRDGSGAADDSRAQVEVTIADADTRVDGSLRLREVDGEWRLLEPFVTVDFPPAPLTYLQVNDRVVELEEHHVDRVVHYRSEYRLLPGRYTFFGDLAGTTTEPESAVLLPPSVERDPPHLVSLPSLSFTDATHAAVQQRVEELLDECAGYEVRQPPYCPFGVARTLRQDDFHVSDVHDLQWRVVEYPSVRVVDVGHERPSGLAVDVAAPGRIALTATGEHVDATGPDRNRGYLDFTAECTVVDELRDHVRAALRPDGTPEVYHRRVGIHSQFTFPGAAGSTCEYAQEGEG